MLFPTVTAANPQFSSCPADQVKVSDRVSTPTWDVPTVSSGLIGTSSTELKTTSLSGQTTMGWGVQGVTYANMDADGNAGVCSFRLFNRSEDSLSLSLSVCLSVCLSVALSVSLYLSLSLSLSMSLPLSLYLSLSLEILSVSININVVFM